MQLCTCRVYGQESFLYIPIGKMNKSRLLWRKLMWRQSSLKTHTSRSGRLTKSKYFLFSLFCAITFNCYNYLTIYPASFIDCRLSPRFLAELLSITMLLRFSIHPLTSFNPLMCGALVHYHLLPPFFANCSVCTVIEAKSP